MNMKDENIKTDISLKVDPKEPNTLTMKVKALKTQFGDAGFVQEGSVFETSEHHAKALIKAGHAEEVEKSASAAPFKHIDQINEVTEKVKTVKPAEKKKLSDNPGSKN